MNVNGRSNDHAGGLNDLPDEERKAIYARAAAIHEAAAHATGRRLVENNWNLLKDSFREYFP